MQILNAHLNKPQEQHLKKQQLYGYLPPISEPIQISWTRYAGHYWECKDELISDVLLWISTYGHTCIGWPAKIYRQQFCANIRRNLKGRSGAIEDNDRWRERERERESTFNPYNLVWSDFLFSLFIQTNQHHPLHTLIKIFLSLKQEYLKAILKSRSTLKPLTWMQIPQPLRFIVMWSFSVISIHLNLQQNSHIHVIFYSKNSLITDPYLYKIVVITPLPMI